MLLPRLQPPLRAALTSINRSGSSHIPHASLIEAFTQFNLFPRTTKQGTIRHASHQAQGAVNKAKDGPGKRLGAKKASEQYVIPGNIIFRQRGTQWFPGDNCAMGRDHTIYATQPGYVRFYKDPELHPRRQYIGVVFQRGQTLPVPRNAPRRRRLGMVALKRDVDVDVDVNVNVEVEGAALEGGEGGNILTDVPGLEAAEHVVLETKTAQTSQTQTQQAKDDKPTRNLQLRDGYMYRESNWEIGRAAERAGVKVKAFKPGDRWTAWRKSTIRKAKIAEKRGLSRKLR